MLLIGCESCFGMEQNYLLPVTQPSDPDLALTLLVANVGNSDWGCRGPYYGHLCVKRVEEVVANSIRSLQPEVIFLQETLHIDQCLGWLETDANKVCYYPEAVTTSQVHRLVGPEYSIACFFHREIISGKARGSNCIAVHQAVGLIANCGLGAECDTVARLDQPLPECDSGFSSGSLMASLKGWQVELVNVHANGFDFSCNQNTLQQIFAGTDQQQPLANYWQTIVAGDFNYDPFGPKDGNSELWHQFVGTVESETPFHYLSGPAERVPPYSTITFPFVDRTIDHVLSNFGAGQCQTLGQHPDTLPIDNGTGGVDHWALLCQFNFVVREGAKRKAPS